MIEGDGGWWWSKVMEDGNGRRFGGRISLGIRLDVFRIEVSNLGYVILGIFIPSYPVIT